MQVSVRVSEKCGGQLLDAGYISNSLPTSGTRVRGAEKALQFKV